MKLLFSYFIYNCVPYMFSLSFILQTFNVHDRFVNIGRGVKNIIT